jgi:hypothetical protein
MLLQPNARGLRGAFIKAPVALRAPMQCTCTGCMGGRVGSSRRHRPACSSVLKVWGLWFGVYGLGFGVRAFLEASPACLQPCLDRVDRLCVDLVVRPVHSGTSTLLSVSEQAVHKHIHKRACAKRERARRVLTWVQEEHFASAVDSQEQRGPQAPGKMLQREGAPMSSHQKLRCSNIRHPMPDQLVPPSQQQGPL